MSSGAQAEVRHRVSVSAPREDGGWRLMPSDPSWDIMPVADPALRAGKRRRLIRSSCAYDPVGLAEPLYQPRHRDQCVVPSALDRVSRESLESPDIVTELTLRRHEHEFNVAASAGPMTDSVLAPQQRALQLAQDALRISNLNDKYLDLVAHTAADQHAVSEISGLTEQASTAAQAVRESMRQVSLAAAALALPESAAE